jgi:hypothetical protein
MCKAVHLAFVVRRRHEQPATMWRHIYKPGHWLRGMTGPLQSGFCGSSRAQAACSRGQPSGPAPARLGHACRYWGCPYLSNTNGELEGLTPVTAAVELLAVGQGACRNNQHKLDTLGILPSLQKGQCSTSRARLPTYAKTVRLDCVCTVPTAPSDAVAHLCSAP